MRTLLQIYVGDHLAASAGGIALARRCQRNNRGTALGTVMEAIADEIQADARVLSEIATELGARRSRVKRVAVIVGERLARLKLNGRLGSYSPLSRVIELEGLMAAIDMKRSLWRSLAASPFAPMLARFDLAALVERAADQRRRLVVHHEQAAATAL